MEASTVIEQVSAPSHISAFTPDLIFVRAFRLSLRNEFPFAGSQKSCSGFCRVIPVRPISAPEGSTFGPNGQTKRTPKNLDDPPAILVPSMVISGVRLEGLIRRRMV